MFCEKWNGKNYEQKIFLTYVIDFLRVIFIFMREKNVGSLFSYGIRFIVSKPDCMIYGVLDIEGNEIIPVIYNEIKLLHGKGRAAELTGTRYFKAKYKNTYIIFDYDGNIVCFLES